MSKKAIVLGARKDAFNIGSVIRESLNQSGWQVASHDCYQSSEPGAVGGYCVPDNLPWNETDALIISLGATFMHDFPQVTTAQIQIVVDACLTLPLQCANEYVAERLMAGGNIIFIGSYAHRHPFNSGTAYCAAKAGLDMATKTLGWELTDMGYQVNCIHPYHVPGTPMWEEVQEGVMRNKGMTREEADEYAVKDAKMPLARPGDIAEVVKMLLTTQSMKWSSGSSIELFGGTR